MNLKKVILNKKYICKLSFRLTAIAFSFLGFIGTFVSLADLVPKIEKLVETLHNLEKKIEKHEMESDDDPAVRKIDTFVEDMIYKINNEE